MLPGFVFWSHLEENSLREWVQIINSLKIGISSISDQAIDLFHVLGDKFESLSELLQSLLFQSLILSLMLIQSLLHHPQSF